MPLRPYCRITVGDYTFPYCVSVETSQSWESFTGTATVTMPSKFQDANKRIINLQSGQAAFRAGDAVKIELGYFPYLDTVFEGYIAQVIPDSPFVLMCEDDSYRLKQQNIANYYNTSTSVNDIVSHVVSGTGVSFQAVDANLGAFRISNKDYVNVVDVLDILRSKYGLYSWIRNRTLYVGLPYSQTFFTPSDRTFIFNGQRGNIIAEGTNLEYQIRGQKDIVLKGISIRLDNTKTELYCFYDAAGNVVVSPVPGQGEQSTFTYIELNELELAQRLRDTLPTIIYTGYTGSFQTFGMPFTQPLDRVTLIDNKFPDRNGTYLVKSVARRFSVDEGYRQEIELDIILS